MGHCWCWWMDACEDVTVQRGSFEGRVRELGKRGHEPVETIMMLMPLDLIYYISVQSKTTVSFSYNSTSKCEHGCKHH